MISSLSSPQTKPLSGVYKDESNPMPSHRNGARTKTGDIYHSQELILSGRSGRSQGVGRLNSSPIQQSESSPTKRSPAPDIFILQETASAISSSPELIKPTEVRLADFHTRGLGGLFSASVKRNAKNTIPTLFIHPPLSPRYP